MTLYLVTLLLSALVLTAAHSLRKSNLVIPHAQIEGKCVFLCVHTVLFNSVSLIHSTDL